METHRRNAEKTRKRILERAETLFADKGLEATRLDAIAQAAGIRRSSVIYYFPTKKAIYEAVLQDLFAPLVERITRSMASSSGEDRITQFTSEWIDFVAERPTAVRIILREIADQGGEQQQFMKVQALPILKMLQYLIEDGQSRGDYAPIDPIHFVTAVCGATLIFVGATPMLGSDWPHSAVSSDQIAEHKAEVLAIAEHLLRRKS